MGNPGEVEASVRDCAVEIREHMVLVGKAFERTDGAQDLEVTCAGALEEHGDAATFEFGHDLAERLGARGVEDLELWEAQDHHATSLTAVSSVRNRCAAPKNSAPSRR